MVGETTAAAATKIAATKMAPSTITVTAMKTTAEAKKCCNTKIAASTKRAAA